MAQVRADDHAGFRTVPKRIEDFTDLPVVGLTDQQGHDGKVVQDHLQEGQVDLETVFP